MCIHILFIQSGEYAQQTILRRRNARLRSSARIFLTYFNGISIPGDLIGNTYISIFEQLLRKFLCGNKISSAGKKSPMEKKNLHRRHRLSLQQTSFFSRDEFRTVLLQYWNNNLRNEYYFNFIFLLWLYYSDSIRRTSRCIEKACLSSTLLRIVPETLTLMKRGYSALK